MSANLIPILWEATLQTIYMVVVSGLIGTVLGLPLGVFLATSKRGELLSAPAVNAALGLVVNALRSIPFIILVVAIIPFTRMIAGTSIGTTAAIVPLTLAAAPFIARIVETAIREVDGGLIEAARAMGATPGQIISKVLLPEALPGIVLGLTLAIVSLIGYSAMVGAVGGEGLGDLGIRYGYQRFMPDVMLAVVVILIVLVQAVQESIYERFMEKAVKRVEAIKQGDPRATDTMIGAQASKEQHDKIRSYFDIGRGEGAEVLTGGDVADLGGELSSGYYIKPTIFRGSNKMRVFQEEIFGPVVSVTTFKTEAEALEIANDTLYGLGAGVWSRDANTCYRMGRGIKAGRVWVNNYHAYPAHAAFGGYKQSGIGRETHKMMLDHYQQTKNMLVSYSPSKLGFF